MAEPKRKTLPAPRAVLDAKPTLKVEVRHNDKGPATCKVWRDGVLVFHGQDFSASLLKGGL